VRIKSQQWLETRQPIKKNIKKTPHHVKNNVEHVKPELIHNKMHTLQEIYHALEITKYFILQLINVT
jgi:hypothetical protein